MAPENEVDYAAMSVEDLEQLNIALGNQIQHLKNQRIELNQVMERKIAQRKANDHVQQLNPQQREALLEELTKPQPITVGLKPGVVGAKSPGAGG